MKKVILAVAVLFSVAMVSCGGEKKAADTVDTTPVEESVMMTEEVVESGATGETVAAAAEVVESAAVK